LAGFALRGAMLASASCSTFASGDAEPIVDVQRGVSHLACLSERHVYIWSLGQHRELLCRLGVGEVGPYWRCVWHPAGAVLAVLVRMAL
jgi:hypothetical protein